jgi:hypothetical protein
MRKLKSPPRVDHRDAEPAARALFDRGEAIVRLREAVRLRARRRIRRRPGDGRKADEKGSSADVAQCGFLCRSTPRPPKRGAGSREIIGRSVRICLLSTR